MKTWLGFGSEHSANLVMIGRFKTEADAEKAKRIIDTLADRVRVDVDAEEIKLGHRPERYTDGMLEMLGEVNIHSIGPGELEQFVYDVRVKHEGAEIVITTDEIDISAFMKVLFDVGARIEIYSAQDYPGTGHGRGG